MGREARAKLPARRALPLRTRARLLLLHPRSEAALQTQPQHAARSHAHMGRRPSHGAWRQGVFPAFAGRCRWGCMKAGGEISLVSGRTALASRAPRQRGTDRVLAVRGQRAVLSLTWTQPLELLEQRYGRRMMLPRTSSSSHQEGPQARKPLEPSTWEWELPEAPDCAVTEECDGDGSPDVRRRRRDERRKPLAEQDARFAHPTLALVRELDEGALLFIAPLSSNQGALRSSSRYADALRRYSGEAMRRNCERHWRHLS